MYHIMRLVAIEQTRVGIVLSRPIDCDSLHSFTSIYTPLFHNGGSIAICIRGVNMGPDQCQAEHSKLLLNTPPTSLQSELGNTGG